MKPQENVNSFEKRPNRCCQTRAGVAWGAAVRKRQMGGREGKKGLNPSKNHRRTIEEPSKFHRNITLATPSLHRASIVATPGQHRSNTVPFRGVQDTLEEKQRQQASASLLPRLPGRGRECRPAWDLHELSAATGQLLLLNADLLEERLIGRAHV